MSEEKCPCCSNNCSKDNLSCGRGRDYFINKISNDLPQTIQEQVIMDLRKCGHMLHHNKELNTDELLSNFSLEELNALHQLLLRIYNNIK